MTAPHAERRPLNPGAASMKSFDGDTPTVPVLETVLADTLRTASAADRAVERGHQAEVVLYRLAPGVYGGAA